MDFKKFKVIVLLFIFAITLEVVFLVVVHVKSECSSEKFENCITNLKEAYKESYHENNNDWKKQWEEMRDAAVTFSQWESVFKYAPNNFRLSLNTQEEKYAMKKMVETAKTYDDWRSIFQWTGYITGVTASEKSYLDIETMNYALEQMKILAKTDEEKENLKQFIDHAHYINRRFKM